MNHPKLEYLHQFVKQGDPTKEFRLVENLGSGTYGEVFKAIQRTNGAVYAVKKLKIDLKEDIRSMCQEIATLRDLRHPNIVYFLDAYRRTNKLWIIMEYCGGKSMQDIYLTTRLPLDESCIAFVTRETLQGLNFMHKRSRIHRDIKGANILLTDDGNVKIADFGVAAQLNSSVAKRSTVIGTPYWMAPEVASAAHKNAGYDCKCDIWAVGITAIEYAELEPPLFEFHPFKVLNMLADKNYRSPRLKSKQWSDKFQSFVQDCLVKNPKNRPDSSQLLMHEFLTNPRLSVEITKNLLDQKFRFEQNEESASGAHKYKNPSNVPSKPPMNQTPSSHNNGINIVKSVIPSNPFSQHNGVNGAANQLSFFTDELSSKKSFQNSDLLTEVMDEFQKRCSSSGSLHEESKKICQSLNKMLVTSVATPKPVKRSILIERRDISQFITVPTLQKKEHPPTLNSTEHIYHCGTIAMPLTDPPPIQSQPRSPQSSNEYCQLMDYPSRPCSHLCKPIINRASEVFNAASRASFYENDEEVLEPETEANNVKNGSTEHVVGSRAINGSSSANSSQTDLIRLQKLPNKRTAPQPPTIAPPLPPRGGIVPAYNESDESGNFSSDSPSTCSSGETEHIHQATLTTGVPPRPPPPKSGTIFSSPRTNSISATTPVSRSHSSGAALSELASSDKPVNDLKEREYQRAQMENGIGVPPTPKVLMGACFMLIFEGCPLKINSTATWVHSIEKCQIILFGTNDGIYYLNIANTADAELQLLVPKRCVWLTVIKDTMMSLSGKGPCLYSHNLPLLLKNTDTISQRSLSSKLLPKRFQPTTKVPNTKGCYIANIIRNPLNGSKYLCAAIEKNIILMEWYNPRGTFIEIKRIHVPCMPSPVLNFDLIVPSDQTYPLVCLGVYKTTEPKRYNLHLINLNNDCSREWDQAPLETPIPVVKVIQLDYNVIIICFQEEAVVVNIQGKVKSLGHADLKFGTVVENVVCLRDSILAFHTHGLRGISFDGKLTQDIHDDNRIYRLLGNDKNTVVEGRLASDPMSPSNIYLLAGHTESF